MSSFWNCVHFERKEQICDLFGEHNYRINHFWYRIFEVLNISDEHKRFVTFWYKRTDSMTFDSKFSKFRPKRKKITDSEPIQSCFDRKITDSREIEWLLTRNQYFRTLILKSENKSPKNLQKQPKKYS